MARPVLYPLRSVDTATVRYAALPHDRRRITIDHRPLADVTPGMLLDWFTHLGGTMSYGDVVIDRYLAWHPIDHIRWELARPAPGGGAGEGARFRIVEAFGGRPEFKVDVVDRVEKLDETGIRLVQRVAGAVIFQLEHTWSAGSGRCALRVRDGRRGPLPLTRTGQPSAVPAVPRRDVARMGQAQHRRGRSAGISTAAAEVVR